MRGRGREGVNVELERARTRPIIILEVDCLFLSLYLAFSRDFSRFLLYA